MIRNWRGRIRDAGRPDQPVVQPRCVDLAADPAAVPVPIQLGFRLGTHALRDYLQARREYRQVIKPSSTCAATQYWPKLRR